MKCQYCDRSVTDDNTGALCAFHLDIEVLAETLQDNGRVVTIESLIKLIQLGLSRGGSFVISPDDLPELITQALAEKYEIPFDGRAMPNREVTQKDYVGL